MAADPEISSTQWTPDRAWMDPNTAEICSHFGSSTLVRNDLLIYSTQYIAANIYEYSNGFR